MKTTITALFILAGSLLASSQTNKLTLEDAVLKRHSKYYPRTPRQLQWRPESDQLIHVQLDQSLVSQLCTSQEIDTLLTLKELNEIVETEDSLMFFPILSFLDVNSIFINEGTRYHQVNLSTKQSRILFELPDKAEHVTFNEAKTWCSYVLDHNLYVMRAGGSSTQVTSDGKPGIVYGQAVHRSEFGISTGMFWSPNGQKLAFYRMDETMVDEYPLVDISQTPAELNSIRYPMAGRTSHTVKLGVYTIGQGIVYMNTEGEQDQYLTSVGWTPDSKSIIIGLLNRDQNHLKVNLYNSEAGNIEQFLFEEKDEKYVEPEHSPWFIPGSNTDFIWMSERSGYQHLYLYNLSGEAIRTITTGEWEAKKILGFDATKNYLYVTGTGETLRDDKLKDETRNATHRFTYMIDFELGGYQLVDSTLGTHHSTLNDQGTYLLDRLSSTSIPAKLSVIHTNTKPVQVLYEASDPLKDIALGKPGFIKLIAGNGESLYGRIIKPSHFDSKKKYPVLIYVYGGPHAQLVRDTYLGAGSLWMYWLAEQGYIVATIDNRGSANRGLEFEQATFKKLGQVEMEDQKTLVDYLQSQTYVDGERMAIHGWSYGGFMTTNMLLTFPGTFKAGVAGGPVCDWSYYEVMYTERYMDTPQSNEEGYEKANLIKRSSTLKDDLMMIHGTNDDVVVWQHSQKFIQSCIKQGTQVDYFIYPGHKHNVYGKDRLHLMTKVTDYIIDRIGPGTLP
ncbi:MAG: DPP IV N-terminal domain-containing protein [Salibacteraceae bacterium]